MQNVSLMMQKIAGERQTILFRIADVNYMGRRGSAALPQI